MKSLAIQQSPCVKSRKIPPPTSKSSTTGSEVRSSTSKGERCAKKSSQVSTSSGKSSLQLKSSKLSTPCAKPSVDKKVPDKPSEEKKVSERSVSQEKKVSDRSISPHKSPSPSRPTSGKLLKSRDSSTLSIGRRKSSAGKKPLTPIKETPNRLELSLSREDLKRLANKFNRVSSSVLQIATSKRPVGVRSLEALLNIEIAACLGEAVNDPAFSQGFVQSTRHLLEELTLLYERGKLNPKLLRPGEKDNRTFIQANPATTICYRDRYFKELVMNFLQSMTSSDIEEEVASHATHSDESRERIRVIREMVRTEAGLEPDGFKELERRLGELRRSLSKNKVEMEKAASDVDRIIAQHIKREQSVKSLQIPKPARDALKACSKRLESGSDEVERGVYKSLSGCCERKLSVTDKSEKYKKSLEIVGARECFEKGNSDEIENIRPQLKQMVHEELLRIKTKEQEILSHDREFDQNIRLGDTPKSSFESVEFKSATSNCSGDEDEIDEKGPQSFLETLRAKIEERKLKNEDLHHSGLMRDSIQVLEKIEENENEMNHRETVTDTESSTSSKKTDSSCCLTTSSVVLVPDENDSKVVISTKKISTENLERLPSETCLIERVKSKLLDKEPLEVKNVLTEMKEAFESFEVVSDVFSAFKISEEPKKETGDTNELIKLCDDIDFCLWDFTVGDVANILVNISDKINELPDYIKETTSKGLTEQRQQAFHIFTVLEQCMNASTFYIKENNDLATLDEASSTVKKFAETFSFISNTLENSPKEMKSESISVLKPPKSLVETLYTLGSMTYFKDCFIPAKKKGTYTNKDMEVVKAYTMDEMKSSSEIVHPNEGISTGRRKKIYSFTRDKKRPEDFEENLDKFEHYMGLTASVMTVQNVSDMFLFLSAVLNDVPNRLKSEKVLDLDPPISLLQALDILYYDDEITAIDIEKKKSFGSLTIQNVSDFLLTLSKTFDDMPDRLKRSTIADLEPPQSLLKAITLLTSLSHLSIPESQSQELEEIEEENLPSDNQDKYFDAVDSVA